MRALSLAIAISLAAPACAQSEEEAAVAKALDETISALESGDLEALWQVSAPDAQTQLLDLHKQIHEALAAADHVYAPAQRKDARAALGEAIVEGIPLDADKAGSKLLARLLDPDKVRLDDKARDGLRAARATIDEVAGIAEIHTSADETFTFQRVDGGWRSKLIMDLLEQDRRFIIFKDNARKVLAAAATHREAWRGSKDPTSPNGAYNLAREALGHKPLEVKTLFTLLDAPARQVALETLKVAREVQRQIQRRVQKGKRKKAYEDQGIVAYVKVETDLDAFAAFAASDKFVSPLSNDTPPAAIEGDETAGAVAVITDAGARIPLARGEDGLWHLTGYDKVLDAKLLGPLKATLAELSGGGKDGDGKPPEAPPEAKDKPGN